eukprot:7148475-Pyramimonas_sp.AAC.1
MATSPTRSFSHSVCRRGGTPHEAAEARKDLTEVLIDTGTARVGKQQRPGSNTGATHNTGFDYSPPRTDVHTLYLITPKKWLGKVKSPLELVRGTLRGMPRKQKP